MIIQALVSAGPHKFGALSSNEGCLQKEERSQSAFVAGEVNPKSNVNRCILLQTELLLRFPWRLSGDVRSQHRLTCLVNQREWNSRWRVGGGVRPRLMLPDRSRMEIIDPEERFTLRPEPTRNRCKVK